MQIQNSPPSLYGNLMMKARVCEHLCLRYVYRFGGKFRHKEICQIKVYGGFLYLLILHTLTDSVQCGCSLVPQKEISKSK